MNHEQILCFGRKTENEKKKKTEPEFEKKAPCVRWKQIKNAMRMNQAGAF